MKRLALCLLLTMAWGRGLPAQEAAGSVYPYCQIVDGEDEPLYRVHLALLPKERFEGYGRSAFVEIEADREVAYFRDVLRGDLALRPRLDTTVLFNSADLNLPDQLVELSLGMEWTLRLREGAAFRAGLQPGLYSDIEELGTDGIHFPFDLAVIQSFTDDVSGLAGLEVRPGFDRTFRPQLKLVWEPSDVLRLALGLPQSRIDWHLVPDWSLHLGFEWNDVTYALRPESAFDRGSITLEDYRLAVGMTHALSDSVYLRGELGRIMERSVSFERTTAGIPEEIDLENGLFLRIGIVGPF